MQDSSWKKALQFGRNKVAALQYKRQNSRLRSGIVIQSTENYFACGIADMN
jgi:hypothetical protein